MDFIGAIKKKKKKVFQRYRFICLISGLPVTIVASCFLHYLELEQIRGQGT